MTVATEFDFGPALRLEALISANETDAVGARWESGRWLLAQRKGKQLPNGLLNQLVEATGKSQRDSRRRMKFVAVTEFDLGPFLRIETRIAAAEGDGIRARWESARELLAKRVGKQLPKGLLDQAATAAGVSRTEIKRRNLFAERYPTEAQVDRAWSTFKSWTAIAEALGVQSGHAQGSANRLTDAMRIKAAAPGSRSFLSLVSRWLLQLLKFLAERDLLADDHRRRSRAEGGLAHRPRS